MPSKILHKRNTVPGSIPPISALQLGEIAINCADGNIFTKTVGNSVESFLPSSKQTYLLNVDLSSVSFQYGSNEVAGVFSGAFLGYNNDVSGAGSTVINGENNDVYGDFNTILNGIDNEITSAAEYSLIAGGNNNKISHTNCFILGSNLSSHAANFTYTENISCANNLYVSGDIVAGNGSLATLCVGEEKIGINTESPTCTLDISGNSLRIRVPKTPTSSTSEGQQGEFCWDENYLYLCIATNTWKRISYSSSEW